MNGPSMCSLGPLPVIRQTFSRLSEVNWAGVRGPAGLARSARQASGRFRVTRGIPDGFSRSSYAHDVLRLGDIAFGVVHDQRHLPLDRLTSSWIVADEGRAAAEQSKQRQASDRLRSAV